MNVWIIINKLAISLKYTVFTRLYTILEIIPLKLKKNA